MNAQGLGIGACGPSSRGKAQRRASSWPMCGPSSGGVPDLPPLVLYGPDGRYTTEAEAIFSGRTAE